MFGCCPAWRHPINIGNSANSLKSSHGMTIVELLVAISLLAILIVPITMVITGFYGDTIKNSIQSRLAVESQNILRSIVEELRVSSGVRDANTVYDLNAPPGGWTTSNDSLVLIISTPAMNTAGEFIMDTSTGEPFQNEIVYFATEGKLYKRVLANLLAPGNRFNTTCPSSLATATCPADVLLSDHFKDMTFEFYDQDDAITTTLINARSIRMTIQLERQSFGRLVAFTNNIRITMRNQL
ncbi:MAG TPA: prepilin-type N-terminal cleavage/methylation domain-containing protein [Candidatus Saccharimonadales bacterium]|nr:prepilin-type N-terminal cleavage/methylation domain-containing protein [Candidatus Saccharimonadales bacterium]